MLKPGARVYHTGHGLGVVVSHNTRKPNGYVNTNLGSTTALAAGLGLGEAIVYSLYDGVRYPYVVKFDSGYTDVYSLDDVTEVVMPDHEGNRQNSGRQVAQVLL